MDKAYIFDFDGTLVDSMEKAVAVTLDYLTVRGISYPKDIVRTLTPLGFSGIAKYYHQHFGVKESPEQILSDFKKGLAEVYATEVEAKVGAHIALASLKARGIRLFTLTGSPHLFLDKCLDRLGLTGYFEQCWTTEDFGLLKGDTAIYKEMAKRIGLPIENCTMVDDGVQPLKTAHEAGMQTIGFYDTYSAENEQEIRSVVDKYVYCFNQLI